VKPLALKLAVAGAAALAVAGTLLLVARTGGSGGTGEHAALLEPLGRAYAKDYGFAFTKAETTVVATLADANREEWTRKIGKALAVGYDSGSKPYRAIPLEDFAEGAKIRMSRDRSPEQVVREKTAAGLTVVEVTWTFGAAPPVKSYTILSAEKRPLFDTLLSMPVLTGPVFEGRHF